MKINSRDLLVSILVLLSVCLHAFAQNPPRQIKKQFMPADRRASRTVAALPRFFEENKGQADTGVKFLSRGKNFNLLLTNNQAVYQMPDADCQKAAREKSKLNKLTVSNKRKPCRAISLQMTLDGARRDAPIAGAGEISARTDYYAGSDESRWQRGIANFESVRYRGIYDGIDAIFRGAGQDLEYDFVVAPGADPEAIRLRFDGAKKISLTAGGELVFKFGGVEIRHRRPVAYQMAGGERREVAVKFVRRGKNLIGFETGAFDASLELIIDPIVYASYLGGTAGGDGVNDIAVDREGNIYTATDARVSRLEPDGFLYTYSDVLISKFTPDGRTAVYFKYIGGAYDDVPYALDVEADGAAVVTGQTYSPDFPLRFAAQSTPPISRLNYDYTGFFIRLYADGDIRHSTYLGGSCPDEHGYSVAADTAGNAYVTGYTCSADFPAENGFQTSRQGSSNAFLTKFDALGHIAYSTFFGTGGSQGFDVFAGEAGKVWVTGFAGSGVPTTAGAYSATETGFLAKFDTNASGAPSLVYSTRIPRLGTAVAADRTGSTWIAISPFPFRSFDTAKVIKLNDTGSQLLFESQNFGQQIRDLAVDGNGSAYFAVNIWADNFSGGIRSKIYALRPNGDEIDTAVIEATRDDRVLGIALGPEPDIVYVGGRTNSLDFPTTPGAYQPTPNSPTIFGQGFFAKVQLNIPEQRNPLIFIPGIMGSSIRGNYFGLDSQFWVNTYLTAPQGLPSVFNLTLDANSSFYREGLYPSDVVRTAAGQNFYKPLLDAFEGMGYKPYDVSQHFTPNGGCDLNQRNSDPNLNPSLFVFPYDWRQDNNQSADKLKEYIQCIQQFYPSDTKINVVAHSMGGLVIRRYILQAQSRNEAHGLEKVITIASPLLGAPESIFKLYTGGKWDFPVSYAVIAPTAIKFLAPHMPSMHQLFPSRNYHQISGGIIRENGDFNGNNIPDENFSFHQIVSSLDTDFPNTTPGTVGAGFHDFSGQDNWQNDSSGIRYFHIVAEQKQLNTTVALTVSKSLQCRLTGLGIGKSGRCYADRLYVPQKGFGDETVPTVSASRMSGDIYLGAPNSKVFYHRSPSNSKFDENKAEHTNVTQASETHQLLANLISDRNEQRSENFGFATKNKLSVKPEMNSLNSNQGSLSTGAPFFVEYDIDHPLPAPNLSNYSPSYYLSITGNTEVVVRDENDNVASIENGFLNNRVEGLNSYESIGENSIMLTFSTDHTYSIEFQSGEIPIGINFVKGKGNFQPSLATRYNDINIPVGSRVKFSISQNGLVELKYDSNQDGEFDVTIPPTASASGELASDVTPPLVNIDVVQQNEQATVTITSQDIQSGVDQILYSLDGQNFQVYSAPFQLHYSSIPFKIQAFADDNVGNRSGLILKGFTFPLIINPTVTITTPSSGDIYQVGTPVNFTGVFTDDECSQHDAVWRFNNISQTGVVNESSRQISGSQIFAAAGVYFVSLTLNNSCGGSGSTNTVDGLTAMIVVYDPRGGFVTGGGWFDSPSGAYTAIPNLNGRASFGFNSKYNQGTNVPTGNIEFQFRSANFNFKSTNYDWLVAGGAKAQFKGTGTINNAGDFGFMITVVDGQADGGGGQDKIRIKIWDKSTNDIIYDNQLNTSDNATPTTLIRGGSIVIHR